MPAWSRWPGGAWPMWMSPVPASWPTVSRRSRKSRSREETPSSPRAAGACATSTARTGTRASSGPWARWLPAIWRGGHAAGRGKTTGRSAKWRNRTCPRLEIGSGPPISSIRAPQITEIKQANRESHTIDMTQGPDNNRPEPYFSDRQPGDGAGPGPEAPASSFGAAQGNAPGSAYPRAGSQAAPDGAMPGARHCQGDQSGGEAAAGQAGDRAALEALKAELAEAQARAAATHEQLLRALAENENIRRRAQEEIAKARKFAIEAFAESLLPVIDSLE